MALTRRDLEMLDRRAALQAPDETIRAPMQNIRRRQLSRLDEKIVAPAKPAPKPEPKSTVVPLPRVAEGGGVPRPAEGRVNPLLPPEVKPVVETPLPAPTMDDAARDVAAATPLDPVAAALGQPAKRKRYGAAATALTGEMGLGNVGNIASKVLLG